MVDIFELEGERSDSDDDSQAYVRTLSATLARDAAIHCLSTNSEGGISSETDSGSSSSNPSNFIHGVSDKDDDDDTSSTFFNKEDARACTLIALSQKNEESETEELLCNFFDQEAKWDCPATGFRNNDDRVIPLGIEPTSKPAEQKDDCFKDRSVGSSEFKKNTKSKNHVNSGKPQRLCDDIQDPDDKHDDNSCSDSGDANSIGDGNAILASKDNARNIGIEDGVKFSSASTMFFSQVAKGSDIANSGPSTKSFGNMDRKRFATQPSEKCVLNNPYQLQKRTKPNVPDEEIFDHNVSDEKTSIFPDNTSKDCRYLPMPQNESEKQKNGSPSIDPELYRPPTHQQKPEPIVHYLNAQTRPVSMRLMTPTNQVFHPPVSNFWQSKFHSFNHMQSEMSQMLAYSDDNVVVSAPTGAGKTCVFEIAMGRLFAAALVPSERPQLEITKSRKIVYISPSKALCNERYDDWNQRLSDIDSSIKCVVLTGDSGTDTFREVATAHVVITTPEKWDSITRRWIDHLYIIGSVKLLLIDEVHLLGHQSRGSCLEAIICRMKTVQRAAKATALDKKYRSRPVPLTTHVVGLGYIGKNRYLFDRCLSRHVPELLSRFSQGRPSIVFCHTKKESETLALELSATHRPSKGSDDVTITSNQAKTAALQRCLKSGIAFHHAGLEASDRYLVEEAFSNGHIHCLCATSTLAMGVNLPAHLVIVKGTSAWRGAGLGHQDLDTAILLQMMGRAGRPGFDTHGTAVIMTDSKSKNRYERLSHGLEVVESQLLHKLVEMLNTEVSQRVITDLGNAIDWVKGTFFWTRVHKNPTMYGLQGKSEQEMNSYLFKKCMNSISELHKAGILLLKDEKSKLVPQPASRIMSQHMIPFPSMKIIMNLPHDAGPLQLLSALSEMEDLHLPVRRSEKSMLNDAHKLIKYKLDGPLSKIRIQSSAQKTFVLLQAAIGQHYLEDYTLRQEMSFLVDCATRALSAAEEYSVEGSRHGIVALESLLLRRSLASSLWGSNDGVLNQLRGVGQKTAAKLATNGIGTFADVLSQTSNAIEQASGRNTPFGQELRSAVSKIMRKTLCLSAYVDGSSNDDHPSMLVCSLSHIEKLPDKLSAEQSKGGDGLVTYTLAVHTDRPGGSLIFRTDVKSESVHRIQCPRHYGRLYLRLVSNLVGLDEQIMLDGNARIEKSSFSLLPSQAKDNHRAEAQRQSKSKTEGRQQAHQDMVQNVDDLRVHKRIAEGADSTLSRTGSALVTPASGRHACRSAHGRTSSPHSLKDAFVTPSPHPPGGTVKCSMISPASATQSSSSDQQRKAFSSGHSIHFAEEENVGERKTSMGHEKSSWGQQKKEQKTLQQRAFGSSKKNPFAAFHFDPNHAEHQLVSLSTENSKTSVIPPSASDALSEAVLRHAERRSRFLTNGCGVRTPSKNVEVAVLGSGRRKRVGTNSVRLPDSDLLRLKAQEHQAYAMTAPAGLFSGASIQSTTSNPHSRTGSFENRYPTQRDSQPSRTQPLSMSCKYVPPAVREFSSNHTNGYPIDYQSNVWIPDSRNFSQINNNNRGLLYPPHRAFDDTNIFADTPSSRQYSQAQRESDICPARGWNNGTAYSMHREDFLQDHGVAQSSIYKPNSVDFRWDESKPLMFADSLCVPENYSPYSPHSRREESLFCRYEPSRDIQNIPPNATDDLSDISDSMASRTGLMDIIRQQRECAVLLDQDAEDANKLLEDAFF